MSKIWTLAVAALATTLFFAGCGGGGGGSSTPPSWTGTKQSGATGGAITYGYSTATDASGNVYVAGTTSGDLDGNTLTGTSDAFITKYNSSGVRQYTRQLGVAGAETWGQSVAIDTSGNVYVAGYTKGGLDGNTQMGNSDFFVTKYNGNGTKQFTLQMGTTGFGVLGPDTHATSVATDASGSIFVAGYTEGNLDGNVLTGTRDFFVTKYDSGGNKQYTAQQGVTGKITFASSVTADASGRLYVVGYTDGGQDGLPLTGSRDAFLVVGDVNGNKLFTRQLGVAGKDTYGNSVAADASGNIYVAGTTFGNLDGNVLTGSRDFFVTQYDSSGNKQYTKLLGVAGALTEGRSVATDASGNVYVAGYTEGNLDGNTLTGTSDFFVTKYSSSGVKQYTRQLGGAAGTETGGLSVATDTNDNVYVAGSTTGNLDGNTLTGTTDFFVTKYNSNGAKQ